MEKSAQVTGVMIRQARVACDLSQAELGKLTSMHRQTIYRIESVGPLPIAVRPLSLRMLKVALRKRVPADISFAWLRPPQQEQTNRGQAEDRTEQVA